MLTDEYWTQRVNQSVLIRQAIYHRYKEMIP